jgi:leucyl-tRNA synthetase
VSERYDPDIIEPKWRERWLRDDLYHAADDDPRPKW